MKNEYENALRKLRKKWNAAGSWLNGPCPQCGGRKQFFYDKYDAICCVGCDVWLTSKCGAPDCPFCSRRPDTPSEALYREEPQTGRGKDWNRRNYQHKTDGQTRHERRRDMYTQIIEYRNQR